MGVTGKKTVSGTLVVLLVCSLTFGWFFYRAFKKFSIEDEIHSVFWPVIVALDDFAAQEGSPPPELAQLVPEFLASLPVSKNVSNVHFHSSPNGTGWRLLLMSDATGQSRAYVAHQGMPLSSVENEDVVLVYHNRWSVIEGSTVEVLAKRLKE